MLEDFEPQDPRFRKFAAMSNMQRQHAHITCYGYGASNQATIDEYLARTPMQTWRPPHVGEGHGTSFILYSKVNTVTSNDVCNMVVKDGARLLPTPAFGEPLPKVGENERLIAILCGRYNDRFEYHTLRQHEGDVVPEFDKNGKVIGEGSLWSGVFGRTSRVSFRDNADKPITDPRKAMFYCMQQGPFFFAVPKDGLDLRLPAEFGRLLDSVIDQEEALKDQAKKKRVNLLQPRLASNFQQLARMVEPKDPTLAVHLQQVVQMYKTGKIPAGGKRPEAFKNR